jgi:hypothetical protein
MSSLPWMCQSHVADAKIRKYETALQAIAGLDWNTMTSDQALANLRNVITIARDAIERQGLTGSPWEWIADTVDAQGEQRNCAHTHEQPRCPPAPRLWNLKSQGN